MRRVIAFSCAGETLLGTLDDAPGTIGLVIVSGGNEIRVGAHRGMALLAARLAEHGVPVFRYDRRGVGDSSGENTGFAGAMPDLVAALATFRDHASLHHVVAFGNCDAATLLATEGAALGIDAVVLANPWTIEDTDPLPPAAAIRAGYAAKLRNPREWWRLLRGDVDLGRLVNGLRKIAATSSQPSLLARRVRTGVADWGGRATVVLATGDATALAYADAAGDLPVRTIRIDTASHSFARPGDMAALEAAIRDVIDTVPTRA